MSKILAILLFFGLGMLLYWFGFPLWAIFIICFVLAAFIKVDRD